MDSLLAEYRLDRPTWFYLSSLLIVAVFFRFGRVWSLRNLDLALLVALSPGLLFLEAGRPVGYVWLFAATAVIVVRLLLDPAFTRRPRTPQNLNPAGMTFLLAVCAAFHVAAVLTTDRLPESAVRTAERAERFVQRHDAGPAAAATSHEPPVGQAATVLTAPVAGLSRAMGRRALPAYADWTARAAALLAHAALVAGLLTFGGRFCGDLPLGAAMATLYLLLPCTASYVAQVNHVLPAALLLWAAILHRNPYAAGGLIGLACGTVFFPVFLLPVWLTFYGRANAVRFAAAVGAVWIALVGSLALTAADGPSFLRQAFGLIDASMLRFGGIETSGVWAGIDGVYRMPVFALYLVAVGLSCLWPKKRTLDALLARSAALVAGTQFWYPFEGGVHLLWYVPLLIVTVFRPTTNAVSPPAAPLRLRPRIRRPTPETERPAAVERIRPLFR